MPSKFDKIALGSEFLDRRVKLLPCQKEMVLYWTNQGLSQRKLAKMFKVSRRTITFIQDPQKLVENVKRRKERGGTMVYYKGGKEWAETVKEHRKYKKEVLSKIDQQ